jgi:ribulose-phosphate 3-epimerase
VHPIEVAPSILAADFARLGAEVAEVAPLVSSVHVDVMDGHYVPNLAVGIPVIASLRAATDRSLDCHLMITDPGRYAPVLVAMGVESITFHPEVEPAPLRLVERLHDAGARVGVAVNPGRPLSALEPLLAHVDLVLVMTVEPGFGGQSFREEAIPTIAAAAAWRERLGASFRIQVDGGIGTATVARAVAAGADLVVAGSSVFGVADRAGAVDRLLRLAHDAVGGVGERRGRPRPRGAVPARR